MIISSKENNNSSLSILSKENISLSKPERLNLLTRNDSVFSVVKKRTAAYRQIEEMEDLYEFICVLLAKMLPDEDAERDFIISEILPEDVLNNNQFKFLDNYSAIEKCLSKISNIFYEYSYIFPDIYEEKMLDLYPFSIIEIVEESRRMLEDNPDWAEEVFKKWDLLAP